MKLVLIFGLIGSSANSALGQLTNGDPYTPNHPVEGELQLVGSSTMSQLAALWANGFQRLHPKVKITIDCRGSEAAAPLLSGGQSENGPDVIGLLSREWIPKDDATEGSSSSPVLAFAVCQDPLAVVVHPENPIEFLVWDEDHRQLRFPNGEPLSGTWNEAGLPAAWSDRQMKVQAPVADHGTRTVLNRWLGHSMRNITEHDSRNELLRAVSETQASIGLVSYSLGGLEKVKLVPIRSGNFEPVPVTRESVDSAEYPLVRSLYVIVADDKKHLETKATVQEFIQYILSEFGQLDVLKDGFLPLSRSEILKQKEKLAGELVR